MAGIYVHIPFCKSRCIYCAFYSTTHLEQRQLYVDTICQEARLRAPRVVSGSPQSKAPRAVSGFPADTIYLGGGTPSQLTAPQLRQILDTLYNIYKVKTGAEVTIEANPDDVTADYAAALSLLPVNRVSMGAQTFDDRRLRFLHRRHTAGQVAQAVSLLRQAGIRNISIDLMYGFPGESLNDWQCDIARALDLGVEHLSAYCLTIEEGTPLYKIVKSKEVMNEDEELERTMYEMLIDKLEAAGYEHYEISNFARPGFRSRHNTSYWTDKPYIGLGAAAHSYDGHYRSWNVSDIDRYMTAVKQGLPVAESELIDDVTRYNDRVMLALRTAEGLDLSTLHDTDRRYLLSIASKHIDQGLLRISQDHLQLTRQSLFVSDMVVSDLMRV